MPLTEAYAWPEGNIALFTGNLAASAVVGYCKNVNAAMVRGWVNRQAMNGSYYDVFTGQRADISFGAVYSYGAAELKMLESATAIHMKFYQSSVNGSAGYMFYSGRFDNLTINGADNGIFEWTISYHANAWSAF